MSSVLKTAKESGCSRIVRNERSVSVLKFGGTSVKNIGRIHHVADIIEERLKQGPVVIVVSAMGDTTDHLLELASKCCSVPDPRELDQLIATGEQVSISLLAMCLLSRGIKARSYTAGQIGIFSDNAHNRSRIRHIKRDVLRTALNEREVVVVAGFQALNDLGDVTTLGRGGSDTTAVAIAARLGANCDIYTDVDGVFTADPNKVENAKLIDKIASNTVLALASSGAQVLHPRAVELARQYGVRLRIRNTFKPEHHGTEIFSGEEEVEFYNPILGVASDSNITSVSLQYGGDSPVLPLKLLSALSKAGASCEVYASSSTGLSLLLPPSALPVFVNLWQQNVDDVRGSAISFAIDNSLARVTLVGSGLSARLDVNARLLHVLGEHRISVKQIICSEQKISLILKKSDLRKAESILHEAFIENHKADELANLMPARHGTEELALSANF